MITGRPEYNLIGTDNDPIPKDEPVLIIRGQDTLAEAMCRIYAVMAEVQLHNLPLAESARELAHLMKVWPTKKPPDLPRNASSLDRHPAPTPFLVARPHEGK